MPSENGEHSVGLKEASNTPSSKRNIVLLLQSHFLRKPGGHWQAKTVFRGWGKACSIFLLISLAWRCSVLHLPSIDPTCSFDCHEVPAASIGVRPKMADSFISRISSFASIRCMLVQEVVAAVAPHALERARFFAVQIYCEVSWNFRFQFSRC